MAVPQLQHPFRFRSVTPCFGCTRLVWHMKRREKISIDKFPFEWRCRLALEEVVVLCNVYSCCLGKIASA